MPAKEDFVNDPQSGLLLANVYRATVPVPKLLVRPSLARSCQS